MIAIAESGSTKTDWFILDKLGEAVSRFKTQGFNPDFHDATDISSSLMEDNTINRYREKISNVYFFGASCSSQANIAKVTDGLSSVFSIASISVEHDLLACAYALSNGDPLITCILGTGSNSAYFDGKSLKEEVPALGAFLGDEASGAYFGKRLLRDCFYRKLPEEMEQAAKQEFQPKWSEIRQVIYGSNQANVFLASFMPFIYQFKNHTYVQKIVDEGIEEFIDAHVCCFAEYPSKNVGFVGTLAHLFQDVIEQKLTAKGFRLVKVIKGPGQSLVDYLIEHRGILDHASTSEKVMR